MTDTPPAGDPGIVQFDVTTLYRFDEDPAQALVMLTIGAQTLQVSADHAEQLAAVILGAAAQARANAALVTHFRRLGIPEATIAATILQVNRIVQGVATAEFAEEDRREIPPTNPRDVL